MQYEAVVLDNDGVLTHFSSPEGIRRGTRQALSEVGVNHPSTEDIDKIWFPTFKELGEVCANYGVDPAELWQCRDEHVAREQCSEVRTGDKPLYDDAIAFLDALDSEISVAIASNNQQETIECIVDHYDLDQWVDVAYGREPTLADLARKKPHPYLVNRALDSLDTRDALYVGDSACDVVAAELAGVDVAFLQRPEDDRDIEPAFTPEYRVGSLHELSRKLDGESSLDP